MTDPAKDVRVHLVNMHPDDATPEQVQSEVDMAMHAAEKRHTLITRIRVTMRDNLQSDYPELLEILKLPNADLEDFALHVLGCMSSEPLRDTLDGLALNIIAADLITHEIGLRGDCPCRRCTAIRTENTRMN